MISCKEIPLLCCCGASSACCVEIDRDRHPDPPDCSITPARIILWTMLHHVSDVNVSVNVNVDANFVRLRGFG